MSEINETLFEGEAEEYARIIENYPIDHTDCMRILRAAARLKELGVPTTEIVRYLYKEEYKRLGE